MQNTSVSLPQQIITISDRHYEIVRQIGSGGFGTVYEARDVDTRTRVAIKRMDVARRTDELLAEFFRRERRALLSIMHPNVVHIIGASTPPDQSRALVLEYLEGTPLANNEPGSAAPATSITRALTMTRELCAALTAVHAAGLVHGEIRPHNLFLAELPNGHEQMKLIDFGASFSLSTHERPLGAEDGCAYGVLRYLPPEYAQGLTGDYRADLYGTGLVLFELLTGKSLHARATHMWHIRIEAEHRDSRPALRTLHVPESLVALVARLVAFDPNRRPQTATDVVTDLNQIAAELAASADR